MKTGSKRVEIMTSSMTRCSKATNSASVSSSAIPEESTKWWKPDRPPSRPDR